NNLGSAKCTDTENLFWARDSKTISSLPYFLYRHPTEEIISNRLRMTISYGSMCVLLPSFNS
ncbi:MAG: hypothetical protein KAS19_02510, partial [Anaerolineales bacterium]|nr:hypothetical protein [Anaerolineales bacterium]